MCNFKYLSYPPIPLELYQSIYDSISNGNMLECFPVPDEVLNFVAPLFPENYKILTQVIYSNLPIHSDHSRLSAYNFLIDLGGDNVVTNFFDGPPDYNIIENIKFEKYRWHYINTGVPHNVIGIAPGATRICITVYEEKKLYECLKIIKNDKLSIDGFEIINYPPLK